MPALRRWSALAVLVLPVLLISIDMSVLGIAVPALSTDLQPTSAQLLWIIDLYAFLLAGLLILMGSLGDRIGRKRILLIGAPLFGVASLVAAFSTSPEMLIAARALLGLGGATLMPSTLGLIRTVFPDRGERQIAIAVWATAFAGGAALGPILGGILLEHFWWGSVFLLNVPVIIAFLAMAPFLLPESKDPSPGPFDIPSALLSIVGLIGVVYALKTFVKGVGISAGVALLLGAAALTWFVTRQRRLPDPMIDVGLFTNIAFTSAVVINVISVFTNMGVLFFFPQYLMLVEGLGSAEAGLWLLPLAAATVTGTLLAPFLARRLSVRTVIMIGLVVLIGGFVAANFLETATTMLVFAIASMLLGMGVGLAETLTNDVILAAAPPSRASAAAAISETGYEFGGAMGTAVLGTIGMAVYSRQVRSADLPGLGAAEAERASQTLAAAHEAADQMADGGVALRELADNAFTSGMDLVAFVCIGVASLTLLLAWCGLRSEAGRQAAPSDAVGASAGSEGKTSTGADGDASEGTDGAAVRRRGADATDGADARAERTTV